MCTLASGFYKLGQYNYLRTLGVVAYLESWHLGG